MYLLINLSEQDKIQLSLFDSDNKYDFETEARNRELLGSVEKFLHEENIEKSSLQGICTVVGEGSFTNTRVSAVVANTFAYVLNIPVLAISKAQAKNVHHLVESVKSQPIGQYVSAKYSAEPNIG